MKTTTIFGLALLAAVSLGRPCSADITYTFSDYSPLESGYAITSGTITTDGTIGALSGDNITSWNFSLTDGTNTYAASGNSVVTYGNLSDILQATSTAITMSIPSSGDYGGIRFEGYSNGYFLYYQRVNNAESETYDEYAGGQDEGRFTDYFFENFDNANDLTLGANNPWTIATASAAVPEPSSLVMAGLGLAGLAGYGWRRRRRAAIA